MGEFIRVYAYGYVASLALPGEKGGEAVKRNVQAEAINMGFTPDGEPVITWNNATQLVKAKLPVVDRTMPDGR